MERIPIASGEQQDSHLAVRLEVPPEARADGLAVLYMHGFGSSLPLAG